MKKRSLKVLRSPMMIWLSMKGNVQISYDALEGGGFQTVRVPSYEGVGLTKSSYNFYSG